MEMRATKLPALLRMLEEGKISEITFGGDGSWNKYLKIAIANTPGGPMFSLHDITAFGQTSSGSYFELHQTEQLKAEIWKRIAIIEAPIATGNSKLREYMEKKRKERKQDNLDFHWKLVYYR